MAYIYIFFLFFIHKTVEQNNPFDDIVWFLILRSFFVDISREQKLTLSQTHLTLETIRRSYRLDRKYPHENMT